MRTPQTMSLPVVALGLLVLAGCEGSETDDLPAASSQPTAPSDGTADLPTRDDLADVASTLGVDTFATGMCAKCHADDGTGSDRAPDLTDDEWLHCDGSVDGILAVLKSGVPKDKLVDPSRPFGMNPVTNLVKDDAALQALAEYVHGLSH